MNYSNIEIFIQTLVTLFILMDPIGILPLFIALTKDQNVIQKKNAARHIALVVAAVLTISTLFGNDILSYFYIGISEFKVSGGLLLLLMSMQMLITDNISAVFVSEKTRKYSSGRLVTPLGIPLLAGPGAIGTVIIYGQRAPNVLGYGLIIVDVIIASFVAYVAMYNAHHLARIFGDIGIEIITKILALILGAIAIRFICQGLIMLLPGLN
ncbi:MarC family protein [Acidithiobacillus sp.]|uniref:MarC family protein n=1 Tax=Acidithiobacillus sp. TaxID=1872118 RepID=UPI0025C73E9E|nr:NAAT family transporter [Acidithiobacillus sp.]MCK9188475.1 NAAT family transporter [Acidithiobacillus sp.]MCK9358896.1 NAAT family transporter [Acidithiobacillus sp.]